MQRALTALTAFATVGGVWGHAVMQTPAPRVVRYHRMSHLRKPLDKTLQTGPKQAELCGANVTKVLERDITGPIENAMAYVDSDYNCNAYLCRGYQYEDNVDKVHALKAGDVLTSHIKLVAGHHPGYANVSVVDLASNVVIGDQLLYWANWPDSTSGPPRNDTDFNITIPGNLGSACDIGGKCAIQWYWWPISNSQTLPPELRIQIWREHFAGSHGTQIHVFLSSSSHTYSEGTLVPRPGYISLDASTGLPGYDTLGAAMVSSEAWDVFKESFQVGNTKCLRPQNALLDLRGRLVDRDIANNLRQTPGSPLRELYASAAREELRRESVWFAINCKQDLVYIANDAVPSVFENLCGTSWMQQVEHVAFLTMNMRVPRPRGQLERWAQWHELITNPSPAVRQFLESPALKEVLLVVIPHSKSCRPGRQGTYGFAKYQPTNDDIFSYNGAGAAWDPSRSIQLRLQVYFPTLESEDKIRLVEDVTCLQATSSTYVRDSRDS
ncbi:hypothetical protein F5Y19DRAFT_481532 [Xylariaceae sp. FL1651]|nr:hypothetical protein F5Y19DRAFT_481532 [Xylariaceae sp. FL1651]